MLKHLEILILKLKTFGKDLDYVEVNSKYVVPSIF